MTVADDDDLAAGFEKELDPVPGIGDQTGPGPRLLKDACGGGKAVARHAGAVDIQDRPRCAVEGVMIMGVYMAHRGNIRRHGFAAPAVAAQQKATLRRFGGGAKEKFLDAR